jgi:hypothetical protein
MEDRKDEQHESQGHPGPPPFGVQDEGRPLPEEPEVTAEQVRERLDPGLAPGDVPPGDLVTRWRERAGRLHKRANELGNCRAGLELATESAVWDGAADELEAAERKAQSRAEADLEGLAWEREDDASGPDLPEFAHTLMTATDEQLSDAIGHLAPEDRGRLQRALARAPKFTFYPDEAAQFIVGDAKAAWPGFLSAGRGGGKSYFAQQVLAEQAAARHQAAEHGPDLADWRVEVVTWHRFAGETAERATVRAVTEAREGHGEVREVFARREKGGRAL